MKFRWGLLREKQRKWWDILGANVNHYKENKTFRVLEIYRRLSKAEILNKAELAAEFQVSKKTIQRDIDEMRSYFEEKCYFAKSGTIKYDRVKKGYYLTRFEREWLTN